MRVRGATCQATWLAIAITCFGLAPADPVSGAPPFGGGTAHPPALEQPRRLRLRPHSAERDNLVVLTLDALRADHLGLYGYERPTSPYLDALATRSTVFDEAYATSGWTFPGLLSIFTGVYPGRHGFDARGRELRDLPTLLSILHDAGYRVPTLSHLADFPGLHGLAFEPPWHAASDRAPRSDLVAWLRSPQAQQGPFVAWSHRREVHLPYRPPERFLAPFGRVASSPEIEQIRRYAVIPAAIQSFRPDERASIEALYDGDVRWVDSFVGRVTVALREAGLAERTIVLITADHGEELLDHGLVGHASTTEYAHLYQEIVRIPMLLYIPGRAPARVACRVSQIDLLPTILDLLGIAPPEGLDGLDLAPAIEGTHCPQRALFTESLQGGFQAHDESALHFLWSVLDGNWKLIVRRSNRGEEQRELYDLASDPGEQTDRYRARSDIAGRLLSELRSFQDRFGGPAYWLRPLQLAVPTGRPENMASAPVIVSPSDGARLRYAAVDGSLTGIWSGSPTASYVIEYDVGEGFLRTRGSFVVQGNRYTYGPVPAEVWNNLVQLNPWRVRVYPQSSPDKKSAWVRFDLLAERGEPGSS